MTKFLAVDYGSRRIGLAVGDDELRIASPLDVLDGHGNSAADAQAVARFAADEHIDAFVVGLPLNMDDSVGPQAARTQQFISALRAATNLPVHEQDERLSTAAANDQLAERKMTNARQKARRDMLAAAVILQAFLDAKPR